MGPGGGRVQARIASSRHFLLTHGILILLSPSPALSFRTFSSGGDFLSPFVAAAEKKKWPRIHRKQIWAQNKEENEPPSSSRHVGGTSRVERFLLFPG